MANFRNSQELGKNQIYPGRTWGLGIIGQTQPARSGIFLDESLDPIDGYKTCLTEVIDWPFSADENGYSFDQSNLYGVRTRCWRNADLTGDKNDQWTAVPKTLPSGYTIQKRHSSMTNFVDNLDGVGPNSSGVTAYGIRTATTNDLYAAPNYYFWAPMNLGQQGIVRSSTSFSTDPDDSAYNIGVFATGHIGFRAGKLTVSVWNDVVAGLDHSGTIKIKAGDVGVVGGYTTLATFTMSHTTTGDGSYSYYDFTLPALNAPHLGTIADFYVSGKSKFREIDIGFPSVPSSPARYFETGSLLGPESYILAPRTDVPLWYFASSGNKCAPGGLVT